MVVPSTCTSGQKLWNPAVARVVEIHPPPAFPSARRRSLSVDAPKSEPPRVHTSRSGKVVAGVKASDGAPSHRGLLVIRCRGWSVPPML